MKRKIQYILLSIIACILLTGCQNVEEPMNTVPSVKTDKVMFIGMTRARLSGNVSSKSNCKFLLSTQEDLSDAVELDAMIGDDEGNTYYRYLDNLTPATTYYVALYATDGYSKVIGNIETFKTNASLGIADVTLEDWDTGEKQAFKNNIPCFLYSESNGEWIQSSFLDLLYAEDKWAISGKDNIGFDDGNKKIYAYHSTGELNVEDCTKIHLWANADFIYGSSEVLNNESPNAHIEMKHVMAKVSFEIKKDAAYKEVFVVNYANLRNNYNGGDYNAIKFDAFFNLLTGELSEGNIGYGHDGLFINDIELAIDSEKSNTIDFFAIPTSFDENQAVLQLIPNGSWDKVFESPLGKATWESGKHYTYPVTVTATGLVIGDVRVEEWNNQEGETIIIN